MILSICVMRLFLYFLFTLFYWGVIARLFSGALPSDVVSIIGHTLVFTFLWYVIALARSLSPSLVAHIALSGGFWFLVFLFAPKWSPALNMPTAISYGGNFALLLILFGIFWIFYTIMHLSYSYIYGFSHHTSRHH